jgi:hypothetical protein
LGFTIQTCRKFCFAQRKHLELRFVVARASKKWCSSILLKSCSIRNGDSRGRTVLSDAFPNCGSATS